MTLAATIVAGAWLAWCAFNLAALVLVPVFHRPGRNAYTNGLVVYVGPQLREFLTPDELAAIIAHEHGHKAHGHNWRNLARRCLFRRPDADRAVRYELEADDYARKRGHGPALARALRKVSLARGDRARARRLETAGRWR